MFFLLSVSCLDISQAIFAPSENSASCALPLTNTNLSLILWFTSYQYPSTLTTLESLYTQRTTNYPRVRSQYISYTGDQEDYIVWSCQTQPMEKCPSKRCSWWVWTFPEDIRLTLMSFWTSSPTSSSGCQQWRGKVRAGVTRRWLIFDIFKSDIFTSHLLCLWRLR